MIRRPIFRQIQYHWGPNDVDLFADRNTTQLKKVRIVASGSWQLPDGYFYPVLEVIPISVSQSTIELDYPLSTENLTRATISSSHDHTLLENGSLFSGPSSSQYYTTTSAQPNNVDTITITGSNMANSSKQQLKARRVEILNNQYQHTALNPEAHQLLAQHVLQDNSTNRPLSTWSTFVYCMAIYQQHFRQQLFVY